MSDGYGRGLLPWMAKPVRETRRHGSDFEISPSEYGFTWGPARVTRMCSDPKHGVWLRVEGARERIEIRITRSGLLRVGKIEKRKERDAR